MEMNEMINLEPTTTTSTTWSFLYLLQAIPTLLFILSYEKVVTLMGRRRQPARVMSYQTQTITKKTSDEDVFDYAGNL